MSGPITDQAVEVLPPEGYLSDEWYEARRHGVSASEIAAVLGLSPWVSRFDCWWGKRTGQDSQPENADMRRGRRYERLILEDWADAHPELTLARVGLCSNVMRPWQLCTPDGVACDGSEPVALVEAKSGARRDEWGEAGTDEIPAHYRCQVIWAMDCLGLNVAYLPVLFGFELREYVVPYDEADALLMRAEAETFLADVRDDRMPAVDGSPATLRRLKLLHPDLEDREAEVPAVIVRQYHAAKRLRDCAETRMRLAENRIRQRTGSARVVTAGGEKVASHSIYDVAERTQTVRAHTVDRLTFTKPKKRDQP